LAVDADDPVGRFRTHAAAAIRVPALAAAAAREAAIWYYAWPRRLAPHVPEGSRAFSVHRRSGAAALMFVLAALAVVEAATVHLVLRRWSAAAAWTITFASLYGAVWLIGMARALALRPILADASGVTLRAALLRSVRIAAEDIAEVRPPKRPPARAEPHYLSFVVLGKPTLIIKLKRPAVIADATGRPAGVTHIGVAPDDAPGFVRWWQEATR